MRRRLERLPPRCRRFIEMVRQDCRRRGVSFRLVDARQTATGCPPGDSPCSGFFDSDLMILAVAIRKPWRQWFEILVHEYCHLQQWANETRLWFSVGTEFLEWLDRKRRLSPSWATRYCRLTRDVELDCERRAVDMIRRYRLPVSLAHYQRRANAYLFAHVVMRELRTWGRHPISDAKHLLALVPSRLLSRNDYETPPAGFRDAFIKDCL